MQSDITSLFTDNDIVQKIQKKLPKLFQIAELETTRGGKIGMEVGSLREKILIALLMHKFGEANVNTDIPITNPEADVYLYNKPFSIKTLSGSLNGLKLVWTVDAESATKFSQQYIPTCDIIFAHIDWGKRGGLYCIRQNEQIEVFNQIGRASYLKLPKLGTNPRGVEMSSIALKMLLNHKNTLNIPIYWQKQHIQFNNFERWIKLWEED